MDADDEATTFLRGVETVGVDVVAALEPVILEVRAGGDNDRARLPTIHGSTESSVLPISYSACCTNRSRTHVGEQDQV